MIINIRNINDTDHYEIELVAKRAFWNLNMPGCDEHYLVHRLWNEPCYIPEISLAATTDEKVVGAILYSKAIIETDHSSIEVLTFGPLCVDPDHQKMGIGKKLLLEFRRTIPSSALRQPICLELQCRTVLILMRLWDMSFKKAH